MRRRELLGLLWTSALGCGPKPDAARSPHPSRDLVTRDDARRRLAELATSYQELMRSHGEHEWSRYAGKLSEGPEAQRSMAKLRAAERTAAAALDGDLSHLLPRLPALSDVMRAR